MTCGKYSIEDIYMWSRAALHKGSLYSGFPSIFHCLDRWDYWEQGCRAIRGHNHFTYTSVLLIELCSSDNTQVGIKENRSFVVMSIYPKTVFNIRRLREYFWGLHFFIVSVTVILSEYKGSKCKWLFSADIRAEKYWAITNTSDSPECFGSKFVICHSF